MLFFAALLIRTYCAYILRNTYAFVQCVLVYISCSFFFSICVYAINFLSLVFRSPCLSAVCPPAPLPARLSLLVSFVNCVNNSGPRPASLTLSACIFITCTNDSRHQHQRHCCHKYLAYRESSGDLCLRATLYSRVRHGCLPRP